LRVVFDTNVVVAGIVAQGLCREILETELPAHLPVLSQQLWDELIEVLRDKFDLTATELPVLQLYRRHATWVEAQPLEAPVCRDADDDWVLATALSGDAEMIVTGDADLLSLESFRGIAIFSPRGFLTRD
jgi:uncharacterized protein